MNPPKELFRFVSLRKSEPIDIESIEVRLIRDPRPTKLRPRHAAFLKANEFQYNIYILLAKKQLETLKNDTVYQNLLKEFKVVSKWLRQNLNGTVKGLDIIKEYKQLDDIYNKPFWEAPEELNEVTSKLWDELYALTILGFNQQIKTNDIADALRVCRIASLVEASSYDQNWAYEAFDEFECIIDAYDIQEGQEAPPTETDKPDKPDYKEETEEQKLPTPKEVSERCKALVKEYQNDINHIQNLQTVISEGIGNGEFYIHDGTRKAVFEKHIIDKLSKLDAKSQLLEGQLENEPKVMQRQLRKKLSKIQSKLNGLNRDLKSFLMSYVEGSDISDLSKPQIDSYVKNLSLLSKITGIDFLNLNIKKDIPTVVVTASKSTLASTTQDYSSPLFSDRNINAVSVGDLHLVEQELLNYELGEIARVENVLQGEQREYRLRKLQRESKSVSTEVSNEAESSTSSTSTERFALENESTKFAQQNFAVGGGVSVAGKYGTVSFAVNASASYASSKIQSNTISREESKKITEEATSSIKESYSQSVTTASLFEDERSSVHGFDNREGSEHISGIYRWVDKVYAARTVNYGCRLMLEFMVPEPAAYFRSVFTEEESSAPEGVDLPIHPKRLLIKKGRVTVNPYGEDHPTLNSALIDESNYWRLAHYYGITDIPQPPEKYLAKSVSLSYPKTGEATPLRDHQAAGNELFLVDGNASIAIQPGYSPEKVGVFVGPNTTSGKNDYAELLKLGIRNNDENSFSVLVGNKPFYLKATNDGVTTNFNSLVNFPADTEGYLKNPEALPVQFAADFEGAAFMNIMVSLKRSDLLFEEWQLAMWNLLMGAYLAQKEIYDKATAIDSEKNEMKKVAAQQAMRDGEYRAIELQEIKRACIDMMSKGEANGHGSLNSETSTISYDGVDAVDQWKHPIENGQVANFFETVFEWDKASYQFYGYQWTHQKRWEEILTHEEQDPIFAKFIKAGMAKVVVPITPLSERSALSYFYLGRLWQGGYLPLFDEGQILDIYEDVERRRTIDPPEQIGESWELTLPSSFVKLQKDGTLPKNEVEWHSED